MTNKFVFLLFLFSACTYKRVPLYLKKEFKYSSSKVILANKLRTDGFYRDVQLFKEMPESNKLFCKSFGVAKSDTSIKESTAILDIMFFKNGTCLAAYLSFLSKDIDYNGYSSIISEMKKSGKQGFVNSLISQYWGLYAIQNDTVKIKVMDRSTLNASMIGAYEQWYKIIDEHTLKPIYFKALSKDCLLASKDGTVKIDSSYYPKSKFYPLKDIQVDPNYGWIINQKWFWQNEQEYKTWKKSKSTL